ncbi:MAG: tyrosine-type recombinase/integrase [Limnobacter sp.]|nr:tyrosine-type recombinase/integrase [Limnobacter sp.]
MTSSWRGFFAYLQEQGKRTDNPAFALKTPRQAKRLPKALQPEKMDQLLHGGLPSLFAAQRTFVLLLLLYATGLRIGEALSLRWSTENRPGESVVHVDRGEVQVLGKGGKPRVVPLLPEVLETLLNWKALQEQHIKAGALEAGTQLRVLDSGWVFLSARGLCLSVRQAQKDVAKWAQEKGMAQRIHPHMLRHTFGTHLLTESQKLACRAGVVGSRLFKLYAGVHGFGFQAFGSGVRRCVSTSQKTRRDLTGRWPLLSKQCPSA